MMTYTPLRDALILAGATGYEDRMVYQDYLYILLADGSKQHPITEQQWDCLCSILGAKDRPIFASNIKPTLQNIAARALTKDAAG